MTNLSKPQSPFTLIVADIHLQPDSSNPINLAFNQFLTTEAVKAEALYILGDLFEMWVGDDIGLEMYQDVIHSLKNLVNQGIPVYLQYGNRDFLMRKSFCQATGIEILPDIKTVELYGQAYLMLHGDTLCTDDHGYQRMRKVFRNCFVQFIFLNLCKKRRLAIGNKMRSNSKQYSEKKSTEIMDVNQTAIIELFKKYPNVTQMIHGHTHRPDHHMIEWQSKHLHRWVLGDWRPAAQIIKIDSNGPELINYEIDLTS